MPLALALASGSMSMSANTSTTLTCAVPPAAGGIPRGTNTRGGSCGGSLHSWHLPRRWLLRVKADSQRTQRLRVRASTAASSTVTNSTASKQASSSSLVLPQQRRLILLRHAKSSWDDPSLRDHDRPLNSRGRKAARQIAERLSSEPGWLPDLILCSDAARTKETLEQMCQAVPAFRGIEARFLPSFYSVAAMDGQTAVHLQGTVVQSAGSGVGTVLCMGHNRGWEEAASEFSRSEVELKTANGALLASELEHADWATAFAHGGWLLHKVIRPDNH